MTITEKLSGEVFEAALKAGVRKDSYYTLDKCNNAMKRVLAALNIERKEVTREPDVYFALQDRICQLAESM